MLPLPATMPPDQTCNVLLTLTAPPLFTVSVPAPPGPMVLPPTNRSLLLQVEPAPVTVAVPVDPAFCPRTPLLLTTVAPPEMVSEPLPLLPTTSADVTCKLEPLPSIVALLQQPAELPTALS